MSWLTKRAGPYRNRRYKQSAVCGSKLEMEKKRVVEFGQLGGAYPANPLPQPLSRNRSDLFCLGL